MCHIQNWMIDDPERVETNRKKRKSKQEEKQQVSQISKLVADRNMVWN